MAIRITSRARPVKRKKQHWVIFYVNKLQQKVRTGYYHTILVGLRSVMRTSTELLLLLHWLSVRTAQSH